MADIAYDNVEHNMEDDNSQHSPGDDNSRHNNLDDPICGFLKITKAEVLFVLKHNLTMSALKDLLQIINHIFASIVVPGTKHLFKKVFKHLSTAAVQHYVCKYCQ